MSPNSTTRSPDQPTNKYAASLTSSQLTYETFEYTNDTASTQTAAHPDRAVSSKGPARPVLLCSVAGKATSPLG